MTAQAVDEKEAMAGAYTQLGHFQRVQGRPAEARPLYAAGLAIRRDAAARGSDRFPAGLAISLMSLGDVAWALGEVDVARTRFLEALAIEREIGYLLGVIRSLCRLGKIACDLGEFAEARRRFVEALAIARQLRDPMNTATAFEAVASLAAAERHDLTAMRLVGAADAIRTAVGSRLDPTAQHRLEQRLAPAGASARRAASGRGPCNGHRALVESGGTRSAGISHGLVPRSLIPGGALVARARSMEPRTIMPGHRPYAHNPS